MSKTQPSPNILAADCEPSLAVLLTVALVGVSAFINVYSVQSILPLMEQDFHATAIQLGHTVGVTTLAMAIISPFIGILSDAIGRRGLIIFSVFFVSVPTGAIYFADNIHTIMFCRFLQGLVVPGIAVVIMAYVGEEYRGRYLAKTMSVYIAGTVLGGFSGRFIIGHLSEFMHWKNAYLIMALMNLVASILVFALLPKSKNFIANRKIRHALNILNLHAHNKDILAACAIGTCLLFTLVGSFTYVNLHLAAKPFYLSSASLANIFAVYLLGVVVTPIGARVISQIGARKTVMLAMVGTVCGLGITLLLSLSIIIIGLALMSSSIFITQSAVTSYIASKVNEGRSLATGLYNMCYYSGGFIGAAICGYAYTYAQWTGTVLLLFVVQFIAFGLAYFLMKLPHFQAA